MLTIIIPVFNQYESVKKCLESVERNTPVDVRVVVVDDASTDMRTLDYLAQWDDETKRPHVLWRHKKNAGFGASVNEWLYSRDEDCIVLNSDTEVPPGWVERLQSVVEFVHRFGGPRVAAVCPVSNSAMVFSVPNAGHQELPLGVHTDDMDRLVQECSERRYPSVPTVSGFCMLLTREALNVVGGFDPIFGRGYGEEVDWCLRARKAGFVCVLDDDLYVWHKNHASFGSARDKLAERAQEVLNERYPEYEGEVRAYFERAPLRVLQTRLQDRLRPRIEGSKQKLKVLHVAHDWGDLGGVEIYLQRLIAHQTEDVEASVLVPVMRREVSDGSSWLDENGVLQIRMNQNLLDASVWAHGFPLLAYSGFADLFFSEVMQGLKPDVVHFHHLGGYGSLALPVVAREHGAKTVVTLHDEWLQCPVLKDGGKCARRQCAPCDGCRACLRLWAEPRKGCNLDFEVQQALVDHSRACIGADAWISPSKFLADHYGIGAHIIPNGVEQQAITPVRKWRAQGKLRVAWVGGVTRKKGWDDFATVARELADDERFEFSVIGTVAEDCSRHGLGHVRFTGAYDWRTIQQRLQQVDVVLPAVLPHEAYGMVVDECVAAGCEVLCRNAAAVIERYTGGLNYYRDIGQLRSWLVASLLGPGVRPGDYVKMPSAKSQAQKVLDVYRSLVK